MNQTPRTDSEAKRPGFLSDWEVFARELERENNKFRDDRNQMADIMEKDIGMNPRLHNTGAKAMEHVSYLFKVLKMERDALKAEVEHLRAHFASDTSNWGTILKQRDKWQQVAEKLSVAAKEYAKEHLLFNSLDGETVDPMGVHEALAEFEKLKEGK